MKWSFLFVFTFPFAGIFSQSRSADSLLNGTWKGTSLCQVKPSACHDEIAIYHISAGNKPGLYHMVMNKEVNGKEEDMGVNEYTFDPVTSQLTCYDEKRKLTWQFTVRQNSMEGKLVYNDVVYRIISLTKAGNR